MAWSWSDVWALTLNVGECVHLPIGQLLAVPLALHDDAPIDKAENMRDLRVFVSTNFEPFLNTKLAIIRARTRLQIFRASVVIT